MSMFRNERVRNLLLAFPILTLGSYILIRRFRDEDREKNIRKREELFERRWQSAQDEAETRRQLAKTEEEKR
ncbi:hypothetical protein CPB86DRAFT_790663 [Serendipita vermifera]|nr:hypothetical protein CPB86DRAFT_790663 [Serendipita vermifera]